MYAGRKKSSQRVRIRCSAMRPGQRFVIFWRTLAHAAAVAANDPKRLEELFTRLGSIEGAAGNLRGALFELIVGHMVRAIEGGSIDVGEIVRDVESNQSREIDVRLVKERKVTVYECKGYQPGSVVHRQEIEQWLKEKLPSSTRRTGNKSNSTARRSGLNSGPQARLSLKRWRFSKTPGAKSAGMKLPGKMEALFATMPGGLRPRASGRF